jgi:hypothetical protein
LPAVIVHPHLRRLSTGEAQAPWNASSSSEV